MQHEDDTRCTERKRIFQISLKQKKVAFHGQHCLIFVLVKPVWKNVMPGTISKLAKVLDMPMEEEILLKAEPEFTNGIPQEKNYLETDLPPSIQKAIDDFIKGEEENVLHLDCLWGELYGAINASQWDNSITLEQADYLRKKYLFGEEEERDD